MLYHLYLYISKTRNLLLSVTNITNISVILYLNSINKFLILILKLVPLILDYLKIITGSRICLVISKGPNCRFPAHINKCRETIASTLNDYCTRWCKRKREHVVSNALNWKWKIFKIIDECVLFYSTNLDVIPPKLKLSFQYLKHGIEEFSYVFGSSCCCCVTTSLYQYSNTNKG